MGMAKHRTLRRLYESLETASNFGDWYQTAVLIDDCTDGRQWRDNDASIHYDQDLIHDHLMRLRGLRESGSTKGLLELLNESLHRLNHDLTRPPLFAESLVGTKSLIENYFAEVERGIRFLCDQPAVDFNDEDKLTSFQNAKESFGNSALLLSGGATLGYYHLGVAKALWDQNLLPSIISGSSMGSIIAAAICTRTDEELATWFKRPDKIDTAGLKANPLMDWVKHNSIFNQDSLKQAVGRNVTQETFAEAYERTGRVLNISVSPTRHQQKPRVLNYRTAPDALIIQACLASSAVPGLFPPVTLSQKNPSGDEIAYLASESWVDGSIEGDLPKLRLSRLQNVNHFIVSQTNPHVLPIVRAKSGGGVLGKLVGVGTRFAQVQSGYVLEVCQNLAPAHWAKTLLRRTQNFIAQDYEGDINIHPNFRFDLYQLMMSNPSKGELELFIREGEVATWPKLALIRYQTLVGRILEECVARIEARLAE